MFEHVFVENGVRDLARTQKILSRFSQDKITSIQNVEDIFGKVRKPYLLKRRNLNLFIGAKKGSLLKEAPPAYGPVGIPRYYFVHQLNCLFECEYCFLQGYFDSPDIVTYVNHEDIITEMKNLIQKHEGGPVWFHGGEFSDNFATAFLDDWEVYWDFMEQSPESRLELRTKSAAVGAILTLKPHQNIVISFSLSTLEQANSYDHKTAPIMARLKAARKCREYGYKVGFHFDPIIEQVDLFERFKTVSDMAFEAVSDPEYISVGTVRFAKKGLRQVSKNYPNSKLLSVPFDQGPDQKMNYPDKLRAYMLSNIEGILCGSGFLKETIYRCMNT